MLDDEIKKQASELVSWKDKESEIDKHARKLADAMFTSSDEEFEVMLDKSLNTLFHNGEERTASMVPFDFSDVEAKQDWQEQWEDAYAKELERREGTLEENERKYESALLQTSIDQDGQVRERIVLYTKKFVDGEMHINMTALKYDTLPPDVQKAFGEKDQVVDQWIKTDLDTAKLHDTFVDYAKDNEGYDTWEEYRDAKGFGKQEVSVENIKEVNTNDKPRETPAVEVDGQELSHRK
ncbi:hypothetical protein [Aquimarina macrocephali]|uniref:hypothetical protein n=1 Tax=Aquimarina macrocephali TaxID=666563 RepID=UPI0004632103|nr:hypothetical protein [Aquimarina macrocephali]